MVFLLLGPHFTDRFQSRRAEGHRAHALGKFSAILCRAMTKPVWCIGSSRVRAVAMTRGPSRLAELSRLSTAIQLAIEGHWRLTPRRYLHSAQPVAICRSADIERVI